MAHHGASTDYYGLSSDNHNTSPEGYELSSAGNGPSPENHELSTDYHDPSPEDYETLVGNDEGQQKVPYYDDTLERKNHAAVVTFDYQKSKDDELDLTEGEILFSCEVLNDVSSISFVSCCF